MSKRKDMQAELHRSIRRAGITPQRYAKGDVEIIQERPRERARVLSRVEAYVRDGKLEAMQGQAAERLFRDWSNSGLDPWAVNPSDVRASSTSMPGCGPGYVLYTRAMRALVPLEQTIVRYVVIEDHEIIRVAADNISRKTLWALLRSGLDRLVAHYGLA